MKCIDFPVSKLKKSSVYHIYVDKLHSYIAAKYDKRTGYFDVLYDELSPEAKRLGPAGHYSAIGREFVKDKDLGDFLSKGEIPNYVVVCDPVDERNSLHRIYELKPGEFVQVGNHKVERLDSLPYTFEISDVTGWSKRCLGADKTVEELENLGYMPF